MNPAATVVLTFLFYLLVFYVAINIFGLLIEKIKIPKIYAALFLGVILSTNGFVSDIVRLPLSQILSTIGMFALLFLLGYNLSLEKLEKNRNIIFKVTFWVITTELIVGSLILHYYFAVDWFLALIVAVSFATVGEVALLPILQEFKLLKTKLGQIILGVAIVDDSVEVMTFVLLTLYIGSFQFNELFRQLLPLVAIASGILTARLKFNKSKLNDIINKVALFVFGPIFFFYAGTEADLSLLLSSFLIILLFTLAIKATKVTTAYLAARKELGTKRSIVMGVSLGIKFSTSIIILIILLQKGMITEELFSVLIGIKIMFKFIVPILLSYLLGKWQLELASER